MCPRPHPSPPWCQPVALVGQHARLEPLAPTHYDHLVDAVQDGVLRSHQICTHPNAPGRLRDTCVYSIIANKWPSVKAHLQHPLARPR